MTVSPHAPDTVSYTGCTSVTPGFNDTRTVYGLRFNDAGLSLAEAAQACGVSERTFRRWEADNRAPLAVLKLLRLLSGRLDALDPAFNRFWIRNGRLFNDQFPDGLAAGDLLAANYTRQERDILRTEIGKLRAQIPAALTSPAGGSTGYNQSTLVAWRNKYHGNQANQADVQNEINVKRIPHWFGFSARAGPLASATYKPKFRNPRSLFANPSAPLASVTSGSEHPATGDGIAQIRPFAPSHATVNGLEANFVPSNQNAASATADRERQACRHLPNLTAPATHGCVAPLSTDGRASLNPAPLVPPAVPLASLESVQCSASRPVSGSSPCADAQADAHKSGDIRPTNYLLCEV